MENSIADYIMLIGLLAAGGGALWYFWPKVKAWFDRQG